MNIGRDDRVFVDPNDERYEQVVRKYLAKPAPNYHPCGCLGPIDGQPKCPCMMQTVVLHDGKYYEVNEQRGDLSIILEVIEL